VKSTQKAVFKAKHARMQSGNQRAFSRAVEGMDQLVASLPTTTTSVGVTGLENCTHSTFALYSLDARQPWFSLFIHYLQFSSRFHDIDDSYDTP
jgi:hypothetical protein